MLAKTYYSYCTCKNLKDSFLPVVVSQTDDVINYVDSGCEEGLVCFERSGFEAVPWCTGEDGDGVNVALAQSVDPDLTKIYRTVTNSLVWKR